MTLPARPTKQDRQAMRELFAQSYQQQVAEMQSKLTRMGLNQDSTQWIEEMYKLHAHYTGNIRKLDQADDTEQYNTDHPWPY